MNDECDDETCQCRVNYPLDRWDLPLLAIGLLKRLSAAFTTTLDDAHTLVNGHQQYRLEQTKVRQEASAEIERLTSGG